jgi:beta-mannosidase
MLGLLVNCTLSEEVHHQYLDQESWEFRQVGKNNWHSIEVPGDIISHLLSREEIPDPFFRFNEDSLQWIEDQNWEFSTKFERPRIMEGSKSTIIFHGLDTYADVFLNDSLILQADNMYRKWEVEVSSLLKSSNQLRIYFHSPIKMEKKRLEDLGYLPINSNERAIPEARTRTFSRKAPFQYGWDWGPRLVTSGIWRSIEMVHVPAAHIKEVFFNPLLVTDSLANYHFETTITSNDVVDQQIEILLSDSIYYTTEVSLKKGVNHFTFPIEINNPELWWCQGYGDPHLYPVTINLRKGDLLIDTYGSRLGVRSLELIQKPDEAGRSFYFELNGIPVFAKGANYIPNETLVSRIDSSTYRRVIKDAVDANMNMLRVWGGAIYEDDLFYELCDAYGILVWQDFMFACETTPPTEYMFESIRQEAVDNVIRLRNHACIAIWCGDNENLHGWHNWGWDKLNTPDIDSTIYAGYRHISTQILPEAVKKYHPGIAYWSTSPASYPGDQLADRKSGDEHDWTIWFGMKDFEAYGENVPRFVSEYGVQSLPDLKTVRAFAEGADLDLESEVMDHRQRSRFDWMKPGMSGNDVILAYCSRYFHSSKDFEGTVYLSQMMQALAFKTGIESHRKNKPYCMGSLYWQLNDCWPTISWATVDYYGKWKAAHYWVRDAFNPLLMVPEWSEQELLVRIINDDAAHKQGALKIYAFPLNRPGEVSLIWEDTVEADFDSATEVPGLNKIKKNKDQGLFFEWSNAPLGLQSSAVLLPDRPKNLEWSDPEFTMRTTSLGSGKWEIELVGDQFAYGVELQSSTTGKWSDNYFSLIPGKNKRVVFTAVDTDSTPEISVQSYIDYVEQ